jgi:hypothetical protein
MAIELEKSRLDFEKSAGEYLKNKDIMFKKEAQVHIVIGY